VFAPFSFRLLFYPPFPPPAVKADVPLSPLAVVQERDNGGKIDAEAHCAFFSSLLSV